MDDYGRRLELVKETHNQLKGSKNQILKLLTNLREELTDLKKQLPIIEESRTIVHKVAEDTQRQLEYDLSELVTLALKAVSDDPYSFNLEFEGFGQRRTECNIYFERDDDQFRHTEVGGGTTNVAEFALRPSVMSIKSSPVRNVILADEPFLRLKGTKANYRALMMVKRISKELSIQIIQVSDERVSHDLIVKTSDKVFMVKKVSKNNSKIEELPTTIERE